MEALGRLFNVVPTADAVEVNMGLCTGVTFIGVGADTYTVQQATDAGGTGAANLAVVDRYYTNTSAAGAAAWVLATQAAGAAVTIASGIVAIEVDATSLGDGFTYLRCSSTAAGLVIAILHDLTNPRDAANLPAAAV